MPSRAYPRGSAAYPKPPARRRGPLIVTLVGAIICFTIVFSASSVSQIPATVKEASSHIHPFRPAAHEPPAIQKNSTSGEAKWYSDWKWLKPFSSSITLDENRSVLPPLRPRPPIYTYYDVEIDKKEDVRAAENQLLLIWRRAWWAQGFKPVILGRAEAMNNPHYELLQGKKLADSLEAELMRWLAWGHMGSGILANWLLLPMGSYDDHLLTNFRKGQYPRLTRYEGLSNGLYSGDQTSINAAIAVVLKSAKLETALSMVESTSDPDMFNVDPNPSDIAFYHPTVLNDFYKPVAVAILSNQAKGFNYLANLITSHLHTTFLNNHSSGIAVLTPYAPTSATLAGPALSLAASLNTCADSPVPHSCPPNNKKCTPCTSLELSFPSNLTNDTSLFTIGTVPHPYTLALLLGKRTDITVRHIRRETPRDRWLEATTQETLGAKLGGSGRIVGFKEVVAGDHSAARGIWATAEQNLQWRDLEWYFGFSLPRGNLSAEELTGPTTGSQLKTLADAMAKGQSETESLEQQGARLAAAKGVLNSKQAKPRARVDMREAVEAWNLADTEAWRFVRAYEARGRMERMKWEEEERKFVAGKEGERRGEGWGRWFDKV
ncbi:hypothetical protein MMC30_001206 [Trapelia coarctata]|nr:hypothetical protein [Trapelia coarctata]